MEIKEIKKEIKRLKRLKLQCKSGCPERIDLHRKIKDLKKQLVGLSTPEPEKETLIIEIKKLDPLFDILEINLNKFTIAELQKHLDKKRKDKKC
jgi:L-lactate utilization protein LutB